MQEGLKILVKSHEIKVSDHGYDELTEDGIFIYKRYNRKGKYVHTGISEEPGKCKKG